MTEPKSKTLYVVMDIGCLECHDPSELVGVFTDRTAAEAAADKRGGEDTGDWHGSQTTRIFETVSPQ